mmetsp:Transcript_47930/g.152939  ORF Transcript_47930/g.152939 Transcript_47930/m.152939 type:complete len:269 (-) Transcript_47930:958-1764(-)
MMSEHASMHCACHHSRHTHLQARGHLSNWAHACASMRAACFGAQLWRAVAPQASHQPRRGPAKALHGLHARHLAARLRERQALLHQLGLATHGCLCWHCTWCLCMHHLHQLGRGRHSRLGRHLRHSVHRRGERHPLGIWLPVHEVQLRIAWCGGVSENLRVRQAAHPLAAWRRPTTSVVLCAVLKEVVCSGRLEFRHSGGPPLLRRHHQRPVLLTVVRGCTAATPLCLQVIALAWFHRDPVGNAPYAEDGQGNQTPDPPRGPHGRARR